MRNDELFARLQELAPLLGRDDIVGYAAARNARIMREELTEYVAMRDALIRKHGTPLLDAEGNPTGQVGIEPGTEGFVAFASEIEQYAAIECEPQVFRLPVEQAVDRLTGAEMLKYEWMFDGWDEQ